MKHPESRGWLTFKLSCCLYQDKKLLCSQETTQWRFLVKISTWTSLYITGVTIKALKVMCVHQRYISHGCYPVNWTVLRWAAELWSAPASTCKSDSDPWPEVRPISAADLWPSSDNPWVQRPGLGGPWWWNHTSGHHRSRVHITGSHPSQVHVTSPYHKSIRPPPLLPVLPYASLLLSGGWILLNAQVWVQG